MSRISEMVLFYSKHSQHSNTVLEVIRANKIPVTLLCVDTQSMRSMIKNSQRYKIKGVPTLFVVSGTKLSIFEGEKVYNWILSLVQGEEEEETPVAVHQENQNPEISFDETPIGEEEGRVYGPKTLKNPTGESVKDVAARLQREAAASSGIKFD